MTLGVVLPETGTASKTEFGIRAEDLGYESVWHNELWGENSLVQLAAVAERTGRVGLGTGIVNVFSRSPAVLAMSANSLQNISGGRFRLGLGVSTRKAIEDLHGMSFERPIHRTHETIELLNALTSDQEPVDHDGEFFRRPILRGSRSVSPCITLR